MAVLDLLKNRAGASWLFLVAATIVSWAVGAEHGTGSMVAVVVLAIAAIKARLVGLDFMELRDAPIPLRLAFEVYCVALWTLLSGLYLWL
ncbi:caa(3)-type oxidase subunit IV [Mycolicibacterium iranicum]|uniref:Caa(3)-type oxidase subunit IV n=1 Tax=Mycolicibacterium iranicum TaxID=912594 RepID=A0A839Q3R9_MYCIR|nr:cytochrome C oxidase subunit IV family protein [Mycolicibacterium iranicum]MBB2990908.1 caa(3)-type oxidase subunit IV [Mycolicibacterium iranicum]